MAVYTSSRHHGRWSTPAVCTSTSPSERQTPAVRILRMSSASVASRKTGRFSLRASISCRSRASQPAWSDEHKTTGVEDVGKSGGQSNDGGGYEGSGAPGLIAIGHARE
eukprot:6203612-Pleurochrysis_carterae.AAC.5